MFGYFKNLSAFRVLLLFLFAVAMGSYCYGVLFQSKTLRENPVKSRQAYETLLQCADAFSSHISDIESVALSLAVQFELLDETHDANSINKILEHVLESAPAYILGAALSLENDEDSPGILAFVHRDRRPRMSDLHRKNITDAQERPLSAREVNLDRHLTWRLLSEPPSFSAERFNISLGVSLGLPQDNKGEALTRSSMEWLREIMARMADTPEIFPVCITPQREYMWLDNGQLYFNLDYPSLEAMPHNAILAKVAEYVMDEGGNLSDSFIKADILGTGWQLLATSSSDKAESRPMSLVFALLVLAAILCEATLVSISHKTTGHTRRLTVSGVSAPQVNGAEGVLRGVYNLLFKYRLINPDQERIDSELKVARDIQFSLVPSTFPHYSSWREFDLYSLLSPAREVGGDYYDFFMLGPDRLVITVGDVSGKGVPAALYMAVCRTAFRSLARQTDDPAQLMNRLNEMLVNDNHSGLYVTIVCFFVDLPTGKTEYVIAGHPAPLWNQAGRGDASFIDAPRETLVGMQTGLAFPIGEMRLSPGDTLLLYTDGVSDARNSTGKELDYDGLKAAFVAASASENCQALIQELEQTLQRHIGSGGEQADDVTLLAFRYWGPGGRATHPNPDEENAEDASRRTPPRIE